MSITLWYEGNAGSRLGKTYEGTTGIIQSQLDLLKDYKNDGRVPSEDLLWEIRLYEYILAQPDPNKAAEDYFDARWKDDKYHEKREVVQILGWNIP